MTKQLKREMFLMGKRAEERADRFMEKFDRHEVREWIRTFDETETWFMYSQLKISIIQNNL